MESSKPTTINSLPAEIRLAIWRATWQYRRVCITRSIVGERPSMALLQRYAEDLSEQVQREALSTLEGGGLVIEAAPQGYKLVKTITSTTAKLPVTLFINSEARTETLKHYQLAFALWGNESHVYFNFSLDNLEVTSHVNLSLVAPPSQLAKLKSVTIPAGYPDDSARISWNEEARDRCMEKPLGTGDMDDENRLLRQRTGEFLANVCPELVFL